MCITFHGLIFHVSDWQENLCSINSHGHGRVVGAITVRFAKFASYCGLVFLWIRGISQNPLKFIHLENFYMYIF